MKPIVKKCNKCGSTKGYYIKEFFQIPVKVRYNHDHEKLGKKALHKDVQKMRTNAYARCVDCDAVLYDTRLLKGTNALENYNMGFGDVTLYE